MFHDGDRSPRESPIPHRLPEIDVVEWERQIAGEAERQRGWVMSGYGKKPRVWGPALP